MYPPGTGQEFLQQWQLVATARRLSLWAGKAQGGRARAVCPRQRAAGASQDHAKGRHGHRVRGASRGHARHQLSLCMCHMPHHGTQGLLHCVRTRVAWQGHTETSGGLYAPHEVVHLSSALFCSCLHFIQGLFYS